MYITHNMSNISEVFVRIVIQLESLIVINCLVSAEDVLYRDSLPHPTNDTLLIPIDEDSPWLQRYPQPYTESEDPVCSLTIENKNKLCSQSAKWCYPEKLLMESDNKTIPCKMQITQIVSNSETISLPVRALHCYITEYPNYNDCINIHYFLISAGPNKNSIFIHILDDGRMVPYLFVKNVKFDEF